jgi:membrane-associated phospholipid phosphatase
MFMGAYLSLTLLCQSPASASQHRLMMIPTLLALPPMIMYSRVRLGVHTVAQCFVGGLLGLTNAVVCTALWQGWSRHGMGLGRSPWVAEVDEYINIALELAREQFGV